MLGMGVTTSPPLVPRRNKFKSDWAHLEKIGRDYRPTPTLEDVLLTEQCDDGVQSIKRCRRDLLSDDVWNLETVFSTWMIFGGNTHDLGSFGEETDEITDLYQILKEVFLTEHGDGVASIKRCRRDLLSDGVWNLETVSGRGRLKQNLESST
ncbi:hypothetical protein Tco_1292005 [Tanacetum coccineum]